MRLSEDQQRFFLTFARPPIILATFAVFAGLELAASDGPGGAVIAIAGFALVTSPLFALAARRFRPSAVLLAALVFDTIVIAAMAAGLARPDLFVLGFVWSMTVAAFLFGPRETLAFAGLSIGAALVASRVSIEIDAVTLGTDLLALAVAGGMLALLSHRARTAESALARERAHDAAALRVAERIRSSLELDEVLRLTVEELGRATGAARSLLRLAATPQGPGRLYEFDREGVAPLAYPAPPSPIERVFAEGTPLVVGSREQADPETAAFMADAGTRSLVAYPIDWHGRVIALVGFHDDRARDWAIDALPLLERVAPQIAAALAQAELFEQQRATLDRMEEFTRLREEVVANVSHELRTPLTSTIGFLQTLEREDVALDQDERRRFLEIARVEAQRLSRLVDDLLELARLGRKTVRMNFAPVRIDELVERALRGLDTDGRDVRLDVPGDLSVTGDGERLLQVMTNLLSNALEHGHGTVTVRGEDEGARVTILVIDEGPGLPRDQAAALFVPFSRWSESPNSTGLGLAIARGIVEAHGGTLRYRSREGDEGHGFVVSLPKVPVAVAA